MSTMLFCYSASEIPIHSSSNSALFPRIHCKTSSGWFTCTRSYIQILLLSNKRATTSNTIRKNLYPKHSSKTCRCLNARLTCCFSTYFADGREQWPQTPMNYLLYNSHLPPPRLWLPIHPDKKQRRLCWSTPRRDTQTYKKRSRTQLPRLPPSSS